MIFFIYLQSTYQILKLHVRHLPVQHIAGRITPTKHKGRGNNSVALKHGNEEVAMPAKVYKYNAQTYIQVAL